MQKISGLVLAIPMLLASLPLDARAEAPGPGMADKAVSKAAAPGQAQATRSRPASNAPGPAAAPAKPLQRPGFTVHPSQSHDGLTGKDRFPWPEFNARKMLGLPDRPSLTLEQRARYETLNLGSRGEARSMPRF